MADKRFSNEVSLIYFLSANIWRSYKYAPHSTRSISFIRDKVFIKSHLIRGKFNCTRENMSKFDTTVYIGVKGVNNRFKGQLTAAKLYFTTNSECGVMWNVKWRACHNVDKTDLITKTRIDWYKPPGTYNNEHQTSGNTLTVIISQVQDWISYILDSSKPKLKMWCINFHYIFRQIWYQMGRWLCHRRL